MLLRHRSSNTSSRLRSYTRRGHVSLPYSETAPTLVLYKRPLRLGLMPFWRHKWRRLVKAILACEIRASISFDKLSSELTQLSKYVNCSTTSSISPWSVKGVSKSTTSSNIALHFEGTSAHQRMGRCLSVYPRPIGPPEHLQTGAQCPLPIPGQPNSLHAIDQSIKQLETTSNRAAMSDYIQSGELNWQFIGNP